MQRPRFYSPTPLKAGSRLALPEAVATHVTRVLRLAAGDPITLFDGSGSDFDAVIEVARRTELTVTVGTGLPVDRESPLRVLLLQGVSRGARMDTVMQKATELGVHAIQPVYTRRTVVRLDPERGENRLQHWQRVVISACEQCGRSTVPVVHPPLHLADAVAALPGEMARLQLDPVGEASLAQLVGDASAVALAIGPEGGFTPDERALLARAGFGALRLGPRILRTETAPLAALSILQFARGDLGGRA